MNIILPCPLNQYGKGALHRGWLQQQGRDSQTVWACYGCIWLATFPPSSIGPNPFTPPKLWLASTPDCRHRRFFGHSSLAKPLDAKGHHGHRFIEEAAPRAGSITFALQYLTDPDHASSLLIQGYWCEQIQRLNLKGYLAACVSSRKSDQSESIIQG